jgi:lambda family phage tail tape measure protein
MQIKPEVMASLKNISFEFNRIVEFSKQFAGILTTIAEPALFTAIVSGFGKVALALEGVGIAAQTANRFLAGSVIGAMVMASYSLVKGGIDASKDAADVDSVKSIYSNIGGKPGGEIDNLTPSLYRKVVDKTALTPEQMALALKQKQLWLYPQTLDSSEDFIFKQKEFDAAATARQKPSGTLTPHKTPPTKEQIAEANAEAIAAAGLVRQTSNDATELSLKTDLSAVKEKLRQRKILYEKGSIDANQWIEDQKDAKDQEIALEEYAIVTTQAALTAEWIAKREHYAKKSDLDKAYQAYTKEWNKLDLDHKLTHDKNSAALDDAELARIAEAGKRKKQTLAENLKAIDDQAKSYQRVLETKRASGTISASGYETALVLSQQQAALSKRSTLSEAIDAGGKPEVLQALRTDLAGVDEELIRLGLTAEKLSLERDWFAGMKRGLQGYTDSAMNLGAQLEAAFGNAFKGMEDALVKFATTGKLNFTDMANSIISDLIRIQIRASITGPLSSALSSGIASLVGGIGGAAVSGAGYGTPVSPETYGGTVFSGSAAVYNSAGVQPVAPTAAGPFVVKHEGGMIVPRFHFGGLASDEVPAILQTRERVLSREQNTIFENFVNTTSAPSSQNVRVEIVNPPGQKNAAASSNATFDAEGMVIGIILKNIDSGGALRQVFAR